MLIIFFYLIVLGLMAFIFVKLFLPEMKKPSIIFPPIDEAQEKLEIMLMEKNKQIQNLRGELKILQAKAQDSDKIKAILEEEIQRLREDNRSIKAQMLPSNVS